MKFRYSSNSSSHLRSDSVAKQQPPWLLHGKWQNVAETTRALNQSINHRPIQWTWSMSKTKSHNVTNTCVFTSKKPLKQQHFGSLILFREVTKTQETRHIWQHIIKYVVLKSQKQWWWSLAWQWQVSALHWHMMKVNQSPSQQPSKVLACKECQWPRGHRVVGCHLGLTIRLASWQASHKATETVYIHIVCVRISCAIIQFCFSCEVHSYIYSYSHIECCRLMSNPNPFKHMDIFPNGCTKLSTSTAMAARLAGSQRKTATEASRPNRGSKWKTHREKFWNMVGPGGGDWITTSEIWTKQLCVFGCVSYFCFQKWFRHTVEGRNPKQPPGMVLNQCK